MLFGVLLVNVVVWYGGELCDLIMFWVGKTLHHGTNSLIECYIEVQSLKTFTTETWRLGHRTSHRLQPAQLLALP